MERKISWEEVFERSSVYDKKGVNIYGIPKGGMIIAGFLKYAEKTYNPTKADLFLDDLIDSGATRNKYRDMYPNIPFVALFDKQMENITDWLVFPWESDHPAIKEDTVQQNIVRILQYLGEDPNREGLKDTPNRIIRSWDEIFSGYKQNIEKLMTVFTETDGYDQMIVCKNIEIYSTCEHHMLPFSGKAHIAYIPNKKVIGISKLARLVDMFARRLQIQERIGQQVTDTLMKHLQPKGAACIIECTHLCMRCRGVNKQHSVMITSSMKGSFKENLNTREEFLQLIKE